MRIIPRNEWCTHKPARTLKSMPLPAKDVWLHHGASGTSTIATANAYVKYHLGRGWSDGGYSFIIAEGKVLELRGPGKVGAHTAGHNATSHGICIAGSYSKTPPAQRDIDALRWLLSHGASQGWWPSPKLTGGHRDAPGAVTSCPGAALHKLIPKINDSGADMELATLIQQAVTDAGFDPGPIDGKPGPQTLAGLTAALKGHGPALVVLLRKAPLVVPNRKWTPVPMDTFYGGDKSLFRDGYIVGTEGQRDHTAYVRWSSNGNGQRIIRFVRDIGGVHNITGTEDRVATPGKDFVSHTWPLSPAVGKPTGFEVWQDSGGPLTVEYAQLKAE